MFQILVSLTIVSLLTTANLNAKWVLADKVDIAISFLSVHLNVKALICAQEEALFVWVSC